MTSNQLRNEFTNFFKEKGHLIRPGISLVPDDPTLLFTSAGMVPMKPYFLGVEEPPSPRIATIQKCFRTSDIENVGKTPRHLTFLEMLGNFSVGDYFKEGAIHYAWEFLTERLAIPKDCLWISVFREDEEAYRIWLNDIKIPDDRILHLTEEDNFWGPVGTTGTGPCGPCSEIYYDLGPEFGPNDKPGGDGVRFLELWNLVFMEFNKNELGQLEPLKKKNIDTGMGLERLALVMQQVNSIFETDLFLPLIEETKKLASIQRSPKEKENFALRVIADHVRASGFLIADGVIPTNEGRGYVLRRIIRRAFRYGRLLSLEKPFLFQIIPVLSRVMREAYPELTEKENLIQEVVELEEEKFRATLDEGLQIFEELLRELEKMGQKIIPGSEVFRLQDTFGFPWELTQELAQERSFQVDLEGYEAEMAKQRARARASLKKIGMELSPLVNIQKEKGETKFCGYDTLSVHSQALAIYKGEERVNSLRSGEEGEIVLEETPFYPERGGQVGDTGRLIGQNGQALVLDTQVSPEGIIIHRVKIVSGELKEGEAIHAEVDAHRRQAISRAHTATHLLHFALRKIIGLHALQSGSLVEPDHLRFDFSHFRGLTEEQICQVEFLVNQLIQENYGVETVEMPLEEAKKQGFTAIFGERYKEEVRCILIGPSRELCGGTHLHFTGEIGYFLIELETGVGANLRRIEAYTGEEAVRLARQERDALQKIANMIGTSHSQVIPRLEKILKEGEERKREAQACRERYLELLAQSLVGEVKSAPFKHLIRRQDSLDIDSLTILSDHLLAKIGEGIVILGSAYNGQALILVRISNNLVKQGWDAGKLAGQLGKIINGSGGGKKEMGRAGGKKLHDLDKALIKAEEIINASIST